MSKDKKIILKDGSEIEIEKFVPFGDDEKYIAVKDDVYYMKNGNYYVVLKEKDLP